MIRSHHPTGEPMSMKPATANEPVVLRAILLSCLFLFSSLSKAMMPEETELSDELSPSNTSQTNSNFNGYTARILAEPSMFYENGGGICVSAENASIACTAMRKGYIDGTGSSVTSAYVYSEWIEVDWVDGKSVLEFTSDSNHACYLSTNGTGYCWGTPNGSPSSLGSSSNGNNPEEITYVSTSLRDLDVGNRATCVITASSKTLYCGGTTGGGNGELVYHSTSCGNWCPINLQYFETTFSEYASSVQIGSYTGCVIMEWKIVVLGNMEWSFWKSHEFVKHYVLQYYGQSC